MYSPFILNLGASVNQRHVSSGSSWRFWCVLFVLEVDTWRLAKRPRARFPGLFKMPRGLVAGATVTEETRQNLKRSLVAEFDGRFGFPGLAIGPYELTVEHTGFAKYVRSPIMPRAGCCSLENRRLCLSIPETSPGPPNSARIAIALQTSGTPEVTKLLLDISYSRAQSSSHISTG
jgi:hypothetical protein